MSPILPVPGQLEAFPLDRRDWRPVALARHVRLPRGYPAPRWETPLPAAAVATLGPAVAGWAERRLGLTLDRWQRYTLARALAIDAAGELVHTLYLASTARQNGKSAICRALIGWAMTGAPDRLGWRRIVSLAGDRAQARVIYGAVRSDAERHRAAFSRITSHAGLQSRAGVLYDVLSRDAVRTARGLTLDLTVLDEVLVQTSTDLWAAVEPTMLATAHPLAFAISTAGTPRSVLLNGWRERGLEVAAGAPAYGFGMSWWAADPARQTDAAQVRAANPAVADGRVSIHRIERSRAMLSPAHYGREHLNLPSEVADDWLPPGLWRTSSAAQPDQSDARVILAIDAPPSWRRVTVGVAIMAGGASWSGVAGELDASRTPSPTIDLPAALGLVAELVAHWRPDRLVYSAAWSGAPHVASWAADADLETLPLDGRGLRRVSERFRSELAGGRLVHADDPLLAEQVTAARARGDPGAGDWYLSVRDSTGDIDAIRAVIFAAGALWEPVERAPRPMIYLPRSARVDSETPSA